MAQANRITRFGADIDLVSRRLQQFFALTKPRVVSLIIFTAVIGMLLAAPGMVALQPLLAATIGIALVAGAAAATNHVLERKPDALMARTRARPLPAGRIDPTEAALFALAIGATGLTLLYVLVNPLTMWLTLATFVGYGIIYTLILKPRTPQNIVLGGAAGAMPPVLGWTAVTGEVSADALLLFLIIFVWTPPHFWSLALYRREDYERAGIPMLPVTHGEPETRKRILLYTLVLVPVTLLLLPLRAVGLVYAIPAAGLGAVFIVEAWRLWRSGQITRAPALFRFSILYLFALYSLLAVDALLRGATRA